jgi:hypothetical protein
VNIFVDYHHCDLSHSLHLLFEKRLGHKVYRPIGLEWFHEGYWKIGDPYPNPLDTAQQFLHPDANNVKRIEDEVYYCWMPSQETEQKAITLDKFKKMDIDIIISSIPAHDIAFAKLIRDHKPKARHISQMGNLWGETPVKNVMCSFPMTRATIRPDQNVVFYNQEFDLNTFCYNPPSTNKIISSFIHWLPRQELFNQYKKLLPEFTFKSFGAGCVDGCLILRDMAREMQNSMFAWHIKPHGDGFGHVLHNWLASGRPLITNLSDYKHRSNLLIDGETCIDLEHNSPAKNSELIREWSEPTKHRKVCENVYKVFRENVDFTKDADEIKKFIDKVMV